MLGGKDRCDRCADSKGSDAGGGQESEGLCIEVFREDRSEEMRMLVEAAEKARENARPLCSGYKVGAALLLDNRRIASGCNLEYGNGFGRADSRAVHAEESALADAVKRFRNPSVRAAAIVGGLGQAGGRLITPCGNCLDALKTYSDGRTIFIAGEDDRLLLTFDDLMPAMFPKKDVNGLSPIERLMLNEAARFMRFGHDMYSRGSVGRQGCVVMTRGGSMYGGVRGDTASYHPISAVEAAISHAHSHLDPHIESIAIVSDSGYLSGRDRQLIFERADELGMQGMLEVIIKCGSSDDVMLARPRDLLPFAFCAQESGVREKVDEYLSMFDTWREEHGLADGACGKVRRLDRGKGSR